MKTILDGQLHRAENLSPVAASAFLDVLHPRTRETENDNKRYVVSKNRQKPEP